ncbi:MAG: glycoside hydrolase family 16 protein [Fibrobacterales bacterium]
MNYKNIIIGATLALFSACSFSTDTSSGDAHGTITGSSTVPNTVATLKKSIVLAEETMPTTISLYRTSNLQEKIATAAIQSDGSFSFDSVEFDSYSIKSSNGVFGTEYHGINVTEIDPDQEVGKLDPVRIMYKQISVSGIEFSALYYFDELLTADESGVIEYPYLDFVEPPHANIYQMVSVVNLTGSVETFKVIGAELVIILVELDPSSSSLGASSAVSSSVVGDPTPISSIAEISSSTISLSSSSAFVELSSDIQSSSSALVVSSVGELLSSSVEENLSSLDGAISSSSVSSSTREVAQYDGYTLYLNEEFNNEIQFGETPLASVDEVWTFNDGYSFRTRMGVDCIESGDGLLSLQTKSILVPESYSEIYQETIGPKTYANAELRSIHKDFRYGIYEVRVKLESTVWGGHVWELKIGEETTFRPTKEVYVSVNSLIPNVSQSGAPMWFGLTNSGDTILRGDQGAELYPASFGISGDSIEDFDESIAYGDDWVTYRITWLPSKIEWAVNNVVVTSYSADKENGAGKIVEIPDEPEVLALYAGLYATMPHESELPLKAEVDYIRYYRWDEDATQEPLYEPQSIQPIN